MSGTGDQKSGDSEVPETESHVLGKSRATLIDGSAEYQDASEHRWEGSMDSQPTDKGGVVSHEEPLDLLPCIEDFFLAPMVSDLDLLCFTVWKVFCITLYLPFLT